jgi:Na+-driven multidrug efflux pump
MNVTRQLMWSCVSLVFLIAFVALWNDSRITLLMTKNAEEHGHGDGLQYLHLRLAMVNTK